ncbi:MAG: hypothetical protein GYB42_06145 [Alphaproteobacteria bacterium]|nr:hypothetical protein [Alphaproteobacteria bacterium]
MAKSLFHRGQRVYVRPVGTYALIEKIIPHWANGVEEPLRITYDVGFGREFTGGELLSEEVMRGCPNNEVEDDMLLEQWRIQRHPNRNLDDATTSHHPHPGTYPVVLTDEYDWGGWRVPSAEYNREPARIEHQARMIVNAPDLVALCKTMLRLAETNPRAFPPEVVPAFRRARKIMRHIYNVADSTAIAAE